VGGGFAGLTLIQHLRHAPVNIVLIDRCNHHVFQPLLYQVATAALSPDEIAEPTRSILRNARNVTVRLDEAVGVDTARRQLLLREGGSLAYDYLVLATGVEYDYFGHDGWSTFAPSLKTLQDAAEIRGRLLLAFEHAENCLDPDLRQRLLAIVLVRSPELVGNDVAIRIAQSGRRQVFAGDDGSGGSDVFDPHCLSALHRPW
jgi:NADH:ubiquinone reductase (H+-translocating)